MSKFTRIVVLALPLSGCVDYSREPPIVYGTVPTADDVLLPGPVGMGYQIDPDGNMSLIVLF